MSLPIVTARFQGTCGLCTHTIWAGNDTELGDEIVETTLHGWVHAVCADEQGYLDESDGAEATSGVGWPD